MDSSVIYKINTPIVNSEKFDEETVIIHFNSGNYYSLDTLGTEIWNLIEQGANTNMISDYLINRYDTSSIQTKEIASRLIEELLREDLIKEEMKNDSPVRLKTTKKCPQKKPLEKGAGCLQKFTDMQDLLVLDPIHEVDEAGWPHSKQNQEK